MATQAQYAAIPKVGAVVISTANTNRNGTGTIGTVFTAGSNGSRIDSIDVHATATVTAGMIRLFIHDGTSAFLFAEVPVSAATPSGTAPAYNAQFTPNTTAVLPIVIPTGYSLRASTNNAESFNIIAFGGDF
jgi:hypothetical protein